ncbi:MAG: hypothetical protein ACLQLC_17630 [Candidatus Sulfotelmatobacter sp.]
MTRFFATVTVALCLGATATLAISNRNGTLNSNSEARFAADGAFRDGLYLGRVTAQQGQPARPGVGRWSSDQDRTMFAAGYRRGYSESLTSGESAQPVE